MDPITAIGFVGTLVTMGDLVVRASHVAQKTRNELNRQWSEYDVIRLVLKEATETASKHGVITEAIDISLTLCVEHAKRCEKELGDLERALAKKNKIVLIKLYGRRNQRRYAFEAFRDTVLLVRDLVYSMKTNAQLNTMIDVQSSPLEEDEDEIQDWDPVTDEKKSGERTRSANESSEHLSSSRPLQRSLVYSNYTFDATISLPTSTGVKYIPVRGLWDTGSDAFIISREILRRAKIEDDDTDVVKEAPRLHGVGGAVFIPESSIQLTWHVNRNMNSRQDTFYVADGISCDMLVPWKLNIGPRYTGWGKHGQNALILQLGKKTRAQKQEEIAADTQALADATVSANERIDKKRAARERLLEERKGGNEDLCVNETNVKEK